MKKIVSVVLSLMLLCSLLVVDVSAANTYEGEGFRIVTDYDGYIEGGSESDDTFAYNFYCNELGDEARIQIFVLVADSAEEAEQGFYEEFYGYGEDITLGGRPAVANEDEENFFCNVYTYAEQYVFDIEVEGVDSYSYDVLCDILMGIEFVVEDTDDKYEENQANDYDTVGEGFELDTDYKCVMYDSSTDEWDYGTTWSYCYGFEGIRAELEIHVESIEYSMEVNDADSVAELYNCVKDEIKAETEYKTDEISVDGAPAFVSSYDGDECLFVMMWSDNYCYDVEIETDDKDSAEKILDLIVNDFHFTDSMSWVESIGIETDVEVDKNNKNDKTEDEDKTENAEEDNDNSTIIIVAIVVAGVVVLGVVAMVVFGKKKKQ